LNFLGKGNVVDLARIDDVEVKAIGVHVSEILSIGRDGFAENAIVRSVVRDPPLAQPLLRRRVVREEPSQAEKNEKKKQCRGGA
jgi:hypothetical protein